MCAPICVSQTLVALPESVASAPVLASADSTGVEAVSFAVITASAVLDGVGALVQTRIDGAIKEEAAAVLDKARHP